MQIDEGHHDAFKNGSEVALRSSGGESEEGRTTCSISTPFDVVLNHLKRKLWMKRWGSPGVLVPGKVLEQGQGADIELVVCNKN